MNITKDDQKEIERITEMINIDDKIYRKKSFKNMLTHSSIVAGTTIATVGLTYLGMSLEDILPNYEALACEIGAVITGVTSIYFCGVTYSDWKKYSQSETRRQKLLDSEIQNYFEIKGKPAKEYTPRNEHIINFKA